VRWDSWRAKYQMAAIVVKDQPSAFFAFAIAIVGSLALLAQYLTQLVKSGLSMNWDLIGSAYAAAAAASPTTLLVFQIVIMAMIPLLAVGAFYLLVWGSTPTARTVGKDLLIGMAGFVLGNATRLMS
jgi:hypothetical protein